MGVGVYYPYFRGKQFELLAIRESAEMLQTADFCPVIEPVRESMSGLQRALEAITAVHGKAIVIVNPYHGDLSASGDPLTELLKAEFADHEGVAAGILLTQATTTEEALACYEAHEAHHPAFIHSGFTEAKELAHSIGRSSKSDRHIFVEKFCGKLYQKHFKGSTRVLVRDGFQRKKNREYKELEPFSDLHATFREEGMDGFGDFLVVGDDYAESGGPAYAIAIHLTFIDPEQDDAMKVYHFVSDRQDTPQDPAGKFAEALDKMMRVLDREDSKVLESRAVAEFRELYKDGHFPGLGYVKKLSMSHHIETLADYFQHIL